MSGSRPTIQFKVERYYGGDEWVIVKHERGKNPRILKGRYPSKAVAEEALEFKRRHHALP